LFFYILVETTKIKLERDYNSEDLKKFLDKLNVHLWIDQLHKRKQSRALVLVKFWLSGVMANK
jgi:hypothetical protein